MGVFVAFDIKHVLNALNAREVAPLLEEEEDRVEVRGYPPCLRRVCGVFFEEESAGLTGFTLRRRGCRDDLADEIEVFEGGGVGVFGDVCGGVRVDGDGVLPRLGARQAGAARRFGGEELSRLGRGDRAEDDRFQSGAVEILSHVHDDRVQTGGHSQAGGVVNKTQNVDE